MFLLLKLCIFSSVLIQAHTFFEHKKSKIWNKNNPYAEYDYDSFQDTLEESQEVPAKNMTQIIQEKIDALIANAKKEIYEKNQEIENTQKQYQNMFKIKQAETILSQMLRALQSLMSKRQIVHVSESRNKKKPHDSGIAWSYYDDVRR